MPDLLPRHHLAALGLAVAASAVLFASSGAHSTEPAMDSMPMDHAAMGHAAPQVAALPDQVVINVAFEPKTLTVDAGTEVVWVNHDDEPHTVVYSGEAKLFKSPALNTDEQVLLQVFRNQALALLVARCIRTSTATVVVEVTEQWHAPAIRTLGRCFA